MTVEELKAKHPIITNLFIDKDYETGEIYGYQVTFVLAGEQAFKTLDEIDTYCIEAENIIKSLK